MSRPLTVDIPHTLTRAEARRRIENGFGKIGAQFGAGAGAIKHAWTGDTMSFAVAAMGQEISGTLAVLDDVVKMEVNLPGFLAMIAGKVKERVRKEGQLLLK